MPHADILHAALHALPDVILAVEPGSLRVADVNRADVFGHRRDAFPALTLDGLLDLPREEVERFVLAADGRVLDVGVRRSDGGILHATARASNSAALASTPCVLVVVREADEHARVLDEVDRLRATLHEATELLARLSHQRRAKPAPEEVEPEPALAEEERAWIPDLSLPQYASFCVEGELYPGNVREIDVRYGLPDEESRIELHRAWNERRAQDATLDAQFLSLCGQYKEWFQAQQRAREVTSSGHSINAAQLHAAQQAAGQSTVQPAPSPLASTTTSAGAMPPSADAKKQQRTTAPAAPAVEQRQAPLPFNATENTPAAGFVPELARSSAGLAVSQIVPAPPSSNTANPSGASNVRSTIGVTDLSSLGEALPFKNAGPPELTFEQFAALGVELEAYPDRRVDVMAMYGITSEAAWRAVDTVWASRFIADAALRQRWMKLAAELRAKLVRK